MNRVGQAMLKRKRAVVASGISGERDAREQHGRTKHDRFKTPARCAPAQRQRDEGRRQCKAEQPDRAERRVGRQKRVPDRAADPARDRCADQQGPQPRHALIRVLVGLREPVERKQRGAEHDRQRRNMRKPREDECFDHQLARRAYIRRKSLAFSQRIFCFCLSVMSDAFLQLVHRARIFRIEMRIVRGDQHAVLAELFEREPQAAARPPRTSRSSSS